MGDGYADPRILMLGETNHGTTSDGADRTYTDGVVRRAFRDAAGGNGNHWIRTVRNISVMLTGNTSTRAQRGMGYRGLRVFFQHMETEAHRSRSRHAGRNRVRTRDVPCHARHPESPIS